MSDLYQSNSAILHLATYSLFNATCTHCMVISTHVLTQPVPGPAAVSMRVHPHMAVTATYIHTVCDSLLSTTAAVTIVHIKSAAVVRNDFNLCSVFFNMGLASYFSLIAFR